MALHLHRGSRTDLLADALGDLLARPLPDPFAEEFVVVPAKGVERWLTQRLSHRLGAGSRARDGVCAGVRFLNPRSLVALLTGTTEDDPWDPDRFVWPLLDTIDASLDEPWCTTLADHLGHGAVGESAELRKDRRFSVARRLAGLFASYAVQRPQLLVDWREERDTDGAGAALPPDLAWQPPLWRGLLARVDAPPPDVRHRDTVAAITGGADLALPDRLSMFGHTRLPVTELELLRAVGAVRKVHLWLPQASPGAWHRLAEVTTAGPVRRVDDASGRLLSHRLLSSLGRDSRELQRSLTLLGQVVDDEVPDPRQEPDTLLGWLQHDLRHDADLQPPARVRADGARVLRSDDRSVQVHACHGPARQVEVLREVLVGLMEDDPTLEPRDVLVMCPDVEAYAPLFSGTFGLSEVVGPQGHPGHQLRVRLADRGLTGTNPLLALAGSLVQLAGGRATASELLDLAGSGPVRHRFGFDDDEIAELTAWVERAGTRWGLTADLRAPYGLQGFEENTWEAGLHRVLLGVAMAEGDGFLGGRVPLDDVGSSRIDLAGRLAELVDRVEAAVRSLRSATTVQSWMTALRDGVTSLGSVGRHDSWQQAQLDRELASVLDAAETARTDAGHDPHGGGGPTTELRLADVRRLLEQLLRPRPTRANFRTGNLTVCTMVPMRSVPHRVICLVGLDDGVFPRATTPDGDDALLRDPLTGEREPRGEDRQLLLDAILAAGETLVLTYTGANVTNNQPVPPAVPLDELMDALEATAPGARDLVLTRQPLQPFDPSNFVPAPHQPAFSFDRAAADAAHALQQERHRPRPFLQAPLARAPAADLSLAELQSFFKSPVRGFLRQGLDVAVPQEHAESNDSMPVTLEHLDEWAVGDRVLRRILDGADAESVLRAELLRGTLPPKELGERALREVCTKIQALHDAVEADRRSAVPTSVDITVDLADGRRLTGVVPDVRAQRIVRVNYSQLSAKHRLAAWIDLLALAAAFPDQSWTAATYGRFKRYGKEGVAWSILGPVGDEATRHLGELVDVYDRGLREPLPLFSKVSAAWAIARHKDKDPEYAGQSAWRDRDTYPGEQSAPEHVRVFGRGCQLDRLMGVPGDDEDWSDEPTRLGRYARRVWDPLLSHENGKNL